MKTKKVMTDQQEEKLYLFVSRKWDRIFNAILLGSLAAIIGCVIAYFMTENINVLTIAIGCIAVIILVAIFADKYMHYLLLDLRSQMEFVHNARKVVFAILAFLLVVFAAASIFLLATKI